MDKEKFVYRYFIVSIAVGPFYTYINTPVYKLPRLIVPRLLGFLFSILTVLLGFWGMFPFSRYRKSIEAIHINLSGGADITTMVDDLDYDERTNFIFKNILRETSEKVSKSELEMILEIQDFYLQKHGSLYTEENINFIVIALGKVDIHHIRQKEIIDIFDGLKIYNNKGLDE